MLSPCRLLEGETDSLSSLVLDWTGGRPGSTTDLELQSDDCALPFTFWSLHSTIYLSHFAAKISPNVAVDEIRCKKKKPIRLADQDPLFEPLGLCRCANSAAVLRTLPFSAELKVCEPPGFNLWHIIFWFFLDPVLQEVSQVVPPNFFSLPWLLKMSVWVSVGCVSLFLTDQLLRVTFTTMWQSQKVANELQ